MELGLENSLEKSLSARTAFAASDGWNASQNTYSLRLRHNFEFGKHSPPMFVSTLQQEVLETLKPEKQPSNMMSNLFITKVEVIVGASSIVGKEKLP